VLRLQISVAHRRAVWYAGASDVCAQQIRQVAAGELDWRGFSPAAADDLNLAAGVFRSARVRADAAALVVDERTYGYAELAAAAARLAAALLPLAAGGAPLRVGILAARSLTTYAGILGAAWAGGTFVPLNPRHPPARIASILRRAGLSALVLDQRAALHLQDAGLRATLPPHLFAADELAAAVRAGGPQLTPWSSLTAAVDSPVAVDADLTPAEAKRVAQMASAGLARAIRPVFAPFDGDVVFALATAQRATPEPRALSVARFGALAADCLARAVARGVYEASTVGVHMAWRDLR